MKKTTSWRVLSAAAVLAAAWVNAAEPGGGVPDAVDALLGDIDKAETAEKAEQARKAEATRWPRWDGKESVADYAKRAGIKDVEMSLDLGGGVSLKLTLVPAGTFMMGAREAEFALIDGVRTMVRGPEEGAMATEFPRHEVTLSKPFYMGVFEVTQEQYLQVMKEIKLFGHRKLQAQGKTLPVDGIGWTDATEFCKRVSGLTGKQVTLPTEAQWEYACRAGTTTRFWFGDDEEDLYLYANYGRRYQSKEYHDPFDGLAPVGSFKPNPWGLYDTHGNVVEHCSDWMGDDMVSGGKRGGSYANAGSLDPAGAPQTPDWYHVFRGGSWGDSPQGCRSAGCRPYHSGNGYGFRVVVSLKQAEAKEISQ